MIPQNHTNNNGNDQLHRRENYNHDRRIVEERENVSASLTDWCSVLQTTPGICFSILLLLFTGLLFLVSGPMILIGLAIAFLMLYKLFNYVQFHANSRVTLTALIRYFNWAFVGLLGYIIGQALGYYGTFCFVISFLISFYFAITSNSKYEAFLKFCCIYPLDLSRAVVPRIPQPVPPQQQQAQNLLHSRQPNAAYQPPNGPNGHQNGQQNPQHGLTRSLTFTLRPSVSNFDKNLWYFRIATTAIGLGASARILGYIDLNSEAGEAGIEAYLSAAFCEEFFKMLFTGSVALISQYSTSRVAILQLSVGSATGFTLLEDILYALQGGGLVIILMRLCFFPLHICFNQVAALAAARQRPTCGSVLEIFILFLASVGLHGSFDFFLMYSVTDWSSILSIFLMAPLTCCCGFYAWEKGLIDDDDELFMEAFGPDESSSGIHTEFSDPNVNVANFQAPLENENNDNNNNNNNNSNNFSQPFMQS